MSTRLPWPEPPNLQAFVRCGVVSPNADCDYLPPWDGYSAIPKEAWADFDAAMTAWRQAILDVYWQERHGHREEFDHASPLPTRDLDTGSISERERT